MKSHKKLPLLILPNVVHFNTVVRNENMNTNNLYTNNTYNKSQSQFKTKKKMKYNLYNLNKNLLLTDCKFYNNNSNKNYKIDNDNKSSEIYKKCYNNDPNEFSLFSCINLFPIERKKRKINVQHNDKIINSNNIYDEYNGLTGNQFLFKISHNKLSNKTIKQKINANSFLKTNSLFRGANVGKLKYKNFINNNHKSGNSIKSKRTISSNRLIISFDSKNSNY